MFGRFLKIFPVVLGLFLCLFVNTSILTMNGPIGVIVRQLDPVFTGADTQWMLFLNLLMYFIAFLFLRSRPVSGFWWVANPNFWLFGLLLIIASVYASRYQPSTEALTLVGGAVLGQGAAIAARPKSTKLKTLPENIPHIFIAILLLLLVIASVWHIDSSQSYEYHNQRRWVGPWDNPNIFGLLMGMGVVLVAGRLFQSLAWELGNQKLATSKRYVPAALCLVAGGLLARGLFHSYGRGAWLGAICGLVYLVGSWSARRVFSDEHKNVCAENGRIAIASAWFRSNAQILAVALIAMSTLTFWQFRQTEWRPLRRALSATNPNDFSWRNRIAAWEGTLQMMADRPWFGFGWNRPESIYDRYYRSSKVEEPAAIEMNDYLMLGTTLGLPALLCFAAYVWLRLSSPFKPAPPKTIAGLESSETQKVESETDKAQWSKAACRAGAVVLAVGFFFDGGLFKLPTASAFWILIELGGGEANK